jgi:hypothetical protein
MQWHSKTQESDQQAGSLGLIDQYFKDKRPFKKFHFGDTWQPLKFLAGVYTSSQVRVTWKGGEVINAVSVVVHDQQ